MGVCPSRAPRREAITRSTQTEYGFNCQFSRAKRYYEYIGDEFSVEAPGTVVVTNGYVRDVATQGPVTCIHVVECEGFEGVGAPTVGNLFPLPSGKRTSRTCSVPEEPREMYS